MIKIITFSIFTIFYFLFTISLSAQSPSPSKTSEPASSDTINSLKERIASRVAQLKLVERRGVFGKVTEVSPTQLTLFDQNDNTKFIDVDELTKFASPSAKESFGISDITKDTKLSILGLYNKQSRRVLARFIDVVNIPIFIHGTIISRDDENFTISIVSDDNKTYIGDIENLTKTMIYTKEGQLEKSGFSKIKEGERSIVIGFVNVSDKKRVTTTRVLRFPEIPSNLKSIPTQKEEKITPSSGSGKILTPITR